MKGEGSTASIQWIRSSAAIAIAALLSVLFLLSAAPSAQADTLPCGNPSATASGYFFSDYESDEYISGLLTQHFKINPPYTEGRTFKLTWYYHDDACNNAFNFYGSNTLNVTMPAGITDWSIRYATPAHFDVWDDVHNSIIAQADVGAFPSYTSMEFLGSIDGGASTLQSQTLKIQEDGQPPIFTGTLPKDPACPQMNAVGYYFDPVYEHAEYVDHLLRVHLRVLSPYNDGRLIWMQMLSVDASCNRDASIPWLFSMPRAAIPAHIRYFSFRMTSPTHWVLWNDENDTQIICSFGALGCEGDIAEGTPYVSLYGNIDQNATYLFTTPYAPVEVPQGCTENCNSNVLFLPGIEASRLYRPARPDEAPDTEHKLWEPRGDVDAAYLHLDTNGMPGPLATPIYTRDVINEAYGTINIYASFISTMNGLKTGGKIEDWSAAPYDWRLSLDQILSSGAQRGQNISYVTATGTPFIEQELRRLAESSRTHKVTIVVHSNGGLVAKALMAKMGTTTTAELIDKVIMVDVPQVGTPEAIGALLHGEGQGIPSIDPQFLLSNQAARSFAHNAPVAYNLLPSVSYFTYVDDPVATFDPVTLPEWATLYGHTVHSQERLHTFLTDSYGRVSADSDDILDPTQLNDTLLTQAEDMHALLDDWAPPAGVQVIQIAGWGIPTTLKGIEYASTTKSLFCQIIICPQGGLGFTASTTIDGDGTVVTPSQLWMSTATGNVVNYWVDLDKFNKVPNRISSGYLLGLGHKDVLEVDGLLSFISDTIASTTQPLGTYKYLTTEAPSFVGHRLRYELHSPLTLDLYDDLGHHTGISTTTGALEEQIPGTYYMQYGDVKYLFTDASSSVHITMSGYATSTFTFRVEELQGDTPMTSTTFQDIPVTPTTKVALDIASDITTLSSMRIDANSDGVVDYSLAPKLGGTVLFDTIPPEAHIGFSTTTKRIITTGTDDVSTSTIATTSTSTIITDTSGNALTLNISKNTTQTNTATLIIPSLSYSTGSTTNATTSLRYFWRTDKNNKYALFISAIRTPTERIVALYVPLLNKTYVVASTPADDTADLSLQSALLLLRNKLKVYTGLVVPYVYTKQGIMVVGY